MDTSIHRPLRWLYVDFNSYFASVEQQMKPHLRGRPVAVVPVETDSTCAIAASYEAKAFGIKTGTPVHEAKRLCKDIVCVLADHQNYVSYHHRLIEEINKHVPVSKVCSIDEMACYLLSNENSVEASGRIAANIKRGIAKNVGEHIKCSIGVAPNKYLAKVATDLKKPDGFTILQHHDLPGKLFQLKLRDLPGIGWNMEERILRRGVKTVEQLCTLDADQMYALWGNSWGEKMYYYLRGIDIPDEETTRGSIGHSHVMSPELRPPERARLVARRLLAKAATRLRRMDYYASRVTLSIRTEHGPRYATERTCYRAQDSFTFLHLLGDMWQEVMRVSGNARVKKVSVVLYHLTHARDLMPELFSELPDLDLKERAKFERMSYAIDQLNTRFGKDTVHLGALPDHSSFSGTKVAFTRIPDQEEFWE